MGRIGGGGDCRTKIVWNKLKKRSAKREVRKEESEKAKQGSQRVTDEKQSQRIRSAIRRNVIRTESCKKEGLRKGEGVGENGEEGQGEQEKAVK